MRKEATIIKETENLANLLFVCAAAAAGQAAYTDPLVGGVDSNVAGLVVLVLPGPERGVLQLRS